MAREAHLRDVLGLEVVDAVEVDLGVPQELLGRRVEGAADGRERLDEPRRAVGRRPGGRRRRRRGLGPERPSSSESARPRAARKAAAAARTSRFGARRVLASVRDVSGLVRLPRRSHSSMARRS